MVRRRMAWPRSALVRHGRGLLLVAGTGEGAVGRSARACVAHACPLLRSRPLVAHPVLPLPPRQEHCPGCPRPLSLPWLPSLSRQWPADVCPRDRLSPGSTPGLVWRPEQHPLQDSTTFQVSKCRSSCVLHTARSQAQPSPARSCQPLTPSCSNLDVPASPVAGLPGTPQIVGSRRLLGPRDRSGHGERSPAHPPARSNPFRLVLACH